MRRVSTSIILALLVVWTLFALSTPAAANCTGKLSNVCQTLENTVCYVTHKCL